LSGAVRQFCEEMGIPPENITVAEIKLPKAGSSGDENPGEQPPVEKTANNAAQSLAGALAGLLAEILDKSATPPEVPQALVDWENSEVFVPVEHVPENGEEGQAAFDQLFDEMIKQALKEHPASTQSVRNDPHYYEFLDRPTTGQ